MLSTPRFNQHISRVAELRQNAALPLDPHKPTHPFLQLKVPIVDPKDLGWWSGSLACVRELMTSSKAQAVDAAYCSHLPRFPTNNHHAVPHLGALEIHELFLWGAQKTIIPKEKDTLCPTWGRYI